ncbi:transmembrane protein 100 isoform X2 [Corvus kubaryi]|uniref:transmembrane protein 100 isoform X2 n=1 Tax=Corvus kubaryi TaxID=68294 RepID=UPI001C03F78E|nr:transmembrane protein 100 isoform X2 [Corvus kubaryi]
MDWHGSARWPPRTRTPRGRAPAGPRCPRGSGSRCAAPRGGRGCSGTPGTRCSLRSGTGLPRLQQSRGLGSRTRCPGAGRGVPRSAASPETSMLEYCHLQFIIQQHLTLQSLEQLFLP